MNEPDTSITFSVFGEVAEAAANYMVQKYPLEVRKIPLTEFPPKCLYPDIWRDHLGQRANFALLMLKKLEPEFDQVHKNLLI